MLPNGREKKKTPTSQSSRYCTPTTILSNNGIYSSSKTLSQSSPAIRERIARTYGSSTRRIRLGQWALKYSDPRVEADWDMNPAIVEPSNVSFGSISCPLALFQTEMTEKKGAKETQGGRAQIRRTLARHQNSHCPTFIPPEKRPKCCFTPLPPPQHLLHLPLPTFLTFPAYRQDQPPQLDFLRGR